jgi:Uma2 family endonuclease
MAICEDTRYIAWMNIALRTPLTVDDYLAWARTQSDPPRTELINGQIVPMSPERVAHNRTKIQVLLALRQALLMAGVAGEVFIDGLTVPIDDHTAYEPDVLVRCGAPLPPDQMKVLDPVIVVTINRAHGYERQADWLFQAAKRLSLSFRRSGRAQGHAS